MNRYGRDHVTRCSACSRRGRRLRLGLGAFLLAVWALRAGPYPGPPGTPGSTAIGMNDARFTAWADGVAAVQFGAAVDAVWKVPANALGPAQGTAFDVVCLGRGGQITLTFSSGIADGDGADFAVFENSFEDDFIELGFVEVSSNGIDFFRFETDSLTPLPVSAFGKIDPTNVRGFAGKYRQGWGTPFDLNELAGVSPKLNVKNVTHVRIVDVVGDGTTRDSRGRVVWDPYPTIMTAGFDLDAVGVIHPGEAVFELRLLHHGLDYPGVENGVGPQAPGTDAAWSVSSPWPASEGVDGLRWVAEPASGTVHMDGEQAVEVHWRRQAWVEIQGDDGAALPGSDWYDLGSEVPWTVPSPVPVSPGVRRRALPAGGSHPVAAPTVLPGAWITEYRLDLEATRAGLVSPTPGWYRGSVTIRAEDLRHAEQTVYSFAGWTGDLGDGARSVTTPELILDMDRPRRVTALFEFNPDLPLSSSRISLEPGWNLVAVPLFARDSALRQLLGARQSLLPGWSWEPIPGSYFPCEHVRPGAGIWILNPGSAADLLVEGFHPGDLAPAEEAGWQLFGISHTDAPPPQEPSTPAWEWDAKRQVYRKAESLRETRGYWRYGGNAP